MSFEEWMEQREARLALRRCKFCGNSEVAMTYNQPVDWPSCPECTQLVVRNEFRHLFTRMVNSQIQRFPKDWNLMGAAGIKKFNLTILGTFMSARGLIPFS